MFASSDGPIMSTKGFGMTRGITDVPSIVPLLVVFPFG